MNIRIKRVLPLLATLLISLPPAACHREETRQPTVPTVTLSGHILRADGGAPKKADVSFLHLTAEGKMKLEVIPAAQDGAFQAALPKGSALSVHFTAVDHVETVLPIMLDADAGLEIRLKPNPWKQSFESVRITGSWNGYSMRKEEEMTPRDDGSFVWEGTSDKDVVGYQLAGITTNGHTVNGTMSDSYEYDRGGDYRSLVHPEDGKVEIVFSPALLPKYPAEGLPDIRFDVAHESLEQMATLGLDTADTISRFQEAITTFMADGGKAEDFSFDTSSLKEEMLMAIGHGGSEDLRAYAATLLASQDHHLPGFILSADELNVIRDTAPASSPFWSFNPEAIRVAGTGDTAFIQEALDKNPAPLVRREALAALITRAIEKKDKDAARTYYARFKKDFSNLPGSSMMLADLNPDRKIRIGEMVPDFSVTLLDGTKFTQEDLLGHWTLMDFWATWCSPCVGEMPNLHAAWEKFHPEGFEILSLSLDQSREDVEKFREGKWKMPWKNAFVGDDAGKEFTKEFEIVSIPRPLLISPEGRIMAMDPETRGSQLLDTIDALMHGGVPAGE